jgi:hypothetical protein
MKNSSLKSLYGKWGQKGRVLLRTSKTFLRYHDSFGITGCTRSVNQQAGLVRGLVF